MVETEHVNTVVAELLVIPAVGGVALCVMITALVAVHPFVPVTVTVYVAGAVTDKVALVPKTEVPFDHE